MDPAVAAARAAGLRYVTDTKPGIRREIGPLGFVFRRPGGTRIRSAAEIRRILALAVPPAWKDVWICPNPRGHLQATGRDARGRKQHRYHPQWRASRDEKKFGRMVEFARALPGIRRRVARDLQQPGLPRAKVLAAILQLLEKTLIRVGNEEYARQNQSYGLTTMRDQHVQVRGRRVHFAFKGKSGVRHAVDVEDAKLATVVRRCRDLPGLELFQYVDDAGRVRDVKASDVNAYLKEITGRNFTAKDFRTWAGTVLACRALLKLGRAESQAQAKRNSLMAIDAVAGVLGNTRAVCRSSYIHPSVVDAYLGGSIARINKRLDALTSLPSRRSRTRTVAA
jgi:DNA topoisomerase I